MTIRRFFLWLVLAFGAAFAGCSTTRQGRQWRVFCDDESVAGDCSIARTPQLLEFYKSRIPKNQMPGWEYEFMGTGIESVTTRELGAVDGLRVMEARFVLKDLYYTDMQMILQETGPGRFLPVYIQTYNRETRVPSADLVTAEKTKMVVNAGMDYAGTGHFHNRYRITIAAKRDPVVIGAHY